MLGVIFAALIELTGVTGSDLRARAFFDANNVKVGDPMILTIDFLGAADFAALHPPSLAKRVDRRDWKIDDVSAKTDTYRDARRLTYRVRPMREGVLWFPALEFSYVGNDGTRHTVRANTIPVHSKGGRQIVVDGMSEDANGMPKPPDLIVDLTAEENVGMSEDERFAWKRACSIAKADAFLGFDFPAAKLNEARCAILEGNWARAYKIYLLLEWRIGQTADIERGMLAALAIKYDNPAVELPVWRQIGRPLLKYDWRGRAAWFLGGLAAIALLLWLFGRCIKAVACLLLIVGLAMPAGAQGIFDQFERMEREMRQRMQSMTSGFGFHFGEKEEREPIVITASVETSSKEQMVGETFEYIVSLEAPRTSSIGQIQMTPSETFGMKVVGDVQNLEDGKSANPSNVIKRLSVPVRYDVPFKGMIAFKVSGMVSGRQERGRGRNRFSFTFSNSFQADTDPIQIEIRPLPTDNQPADYAGIVSEGLRVHELPDILTLETNDVVCITYKMYPNGYVPAEFIPKDAAFEMVRNPDGSIEYRRFFVADGAPVTPKISIPYYDPRSKSFKRAETGGTALKYITTKEN